MTHFPIYGRTITLHSGGFYDFADPANSVYTIEDIAHALSMTCRWGGHARFFYSVAQHSCYACFHVLDDENRFSALMHDAPEAFLGDVPRPIKKQLTKYADMEQLVEDEIFERFGVPCINEDVHDVDNMLLATEAQQIIPDGYWKSSADYATLIKRYGYLSRTIEPWTVKQARDTFLDLFHQWRR